MMITTLVKEVTVVGITKSKHFVSVGHVVLGDPVHGVVAGIDTDVGRNRTELADFGIDDVYIASRIK